MGFCWLSLIWTFVLPLSSHGNMMVANFMELPEKRDQPDYYVKVAKPLDMSTVQVGGGERRRQHRLPFSPSSLPRPLRPER